MKQILVLLIVSLVAISCNGAPVDVSSDVDSLASPASSANQYVDMVLDALRPFIVHYNLDPLAIPDATASFSKKIGFVKFKGSASMKNGKLHGLSTIRRVNNFIVRGSGRDVSIDGTLGLRNLAGSFSGSAKFMSIKVGLGIKVKVSGIDMRAVIKGNYLTDAHPTLEHFSITHFGSLDVSVSGLGPLGWVLGKVVSVVANQFRGKIRSAIESPLRQQLAAALTRVKFPDIQA